MEKTKSIFKLLLEYLDKNNIELNENTIHKSTYFLKKMGFPLRLRFELLIRNSVYSKDVCFLLDDLYFWDELIIINKDKGGKKYKIGKNFYEHSFMDKLTNEIQNKFNQKIKYINIFLENLELYSIVLFCMEILKNVQENINENSIIEEVKDWKGDIYKNTEILKKYKKLKNFMDKKIIII